MNCPSSGRAESSPNWPHGHETSSEEQGVAAIKPNRAGKEARTPSGWRGWVQEETLEGAGHTGSRGAEPAPLKGPQELERITQTALVDHTAACSLPFLPISYGLLVSHLPTLPAEQWDFMYTPQST